VAARLPELPADRAQTLKETRRPSAAAITDRDGINLDDDAETERVVPHLAVTIQANVAAHPGRQPTLWADVQAGPVEKLWGSRGSTTRRAGRYLRR